MGVERRVVLLGSHIHIARSCQCWYLYLHLRYILNSTNLEALVSLLWKKCGRFVQIYSTWCITGSTTLSLYIYSCLRDHIKHLPQ